MATAIFANATMHSQVSHAYSSQHDEHDEPHTQHKGNDKEKEEDDEITGIQVIVGAGRGMLNIIIILLNSITLLACLDLLVNI